MERWEIEATYEKWWVGKMCRLACAKNSEFKMVKAVNYYGNKVYGAAELVFEDGSQQSIFSFSYRPRKYDVEVKE